MAVIFEGKRITIMGLGLLGRGVGDAEFLAKNGAILTITDLKTEKELKLSLERLNKFKNVTYTLGGHKLEDFRDKDFILKAAGVPLDSMYIEEAKKNNIPIKMSASWFAELSDIPVIGVTGTRGKTTVVCLLHEILKKEGEDVLLGGNIQGMSTLALLNNVQKGSVAVFELDSWQLQGWEDEKMSPHIAVFTTFMKDHLNYYPDMDSYLSDKANIFLNQKDEDTLILGEDITELIRSKYDNCVKGKLVVASKDNFPNWKLSIPGEHNILNAMCAIEAAHAYGIDEKIIKEAVENFKGVPGRLQLIKEINGTQIYNDTTATTPDATLAALKALNTDKQNIILIMGGEDKKLDTSELVSILPNYTKKIVFLSGTGTNVIKNKVDGTVHSSLKSAFNEALESTKKGDIILFSPAFASFGMFKNEYDRGKQFDELISMLA